MDRLARRNRVVCFDRPGFGYSQRPRARIWTATSQAALFLKALIDSVCAIPLCWATHGVRWSLWRSDCKVTILSVALSLLPASDLAVGLLDGVRSSNTGVG